MSGGLLVRWIDAGCEHQIAYACGGRIGAKLIIVLQSLGSGSIAVSVRNGILAAEDNGDSYITIWDSRNARVNRQIKSDLEVDAIGLVGKSITGRVFECFRVAVLS